MGSVWDFEKEVWSSGREGGVSGERSQSILGLSAVVGRISVLVFLWWLELVALRAVWAFCFDVSQFLAAAVAVLRDWLNVVFFADACALVAAAAAAAADAMSSAVSSLDFARAWRLSMAAAAREGESEASADNEGSEASSSDVFAKVAIE